MDPGHYLLRPSYMDGVSNLVDLSGRTLWEMPGSCGLPQRLPELTLVGASRGSVHDVVAIGDDGTVRWRVAGKLGFVHDGVAWIGDKSQSAGYDAATDEELVAFG